MYSPHLSTAQDARAVRTRKALRQALLELLENKPLDQITVRDITAGANIGYASFFRHCQSKEALLDEVTAEQIEQLIGLAFSVLRGGTIRDAAIALFSYVDQHRKLWSTLLTGGAAGAVREQFVRYTSQLAAGLTRPGQRFPTDIAVIFASSGTIELLAWWLRQKKPLPVEQVAEIYDHFVVSPTLGNDATGAWRTEQPKRKKKK